jgi:Mce-associated membrane protein
VFRRLSASARVGLRRGQKLMSAQTRRIARVVRRHPRAVLVALLSAVVVFASVASVLLSMSRSHDQDLAAQREAVLVATDRVVPLLSYNWSTIDQQVASNKDALDAVFLGKYENLIRDSVAPAAKAKGLSIETQVVGASVVSGDTNAVVALLFLNQQVEGNAGSPQLTGSRVKVSLVHRGAKWLISGLDPE